MSFIRWKAVKTNVVGSDNVITAAVKKWCKKAIFLSTDKAAYPINAMGMSKAMMEKNVVARSSIKRKRYCICLQDMVMLWHHVVQ